MTSSSRRVKVQEAVTKQDVERFKKTFQRLGRIQTNVNNQQLSAILGQRDTVREQNTQTIQDERQLSVLSQNLNAVRRNNTLQASARLAERGNVQASAQQNLEVLLAGMMNQSTARYDTNQRRQQSSLSNLLNYTR